MSTLLGFASEAEAEGAGSLEWETMTTGVGKTAAALALARRLGRGPRPALVVVAGVAGAYPDRHTVSEIVPASLGAVYLVARDRLADEGVATEAGFLSLDALGLSGPGSLSADEDWTQALARTLGLDVVDGVTVSTCSGNEELSAQRGAAGAALETMEGASFAAVCQSFGVPMVQLRSVSNLTGDRERARWDLPAALSSLRRELERLHALGGVP